MQTQAMAMFLHVYVRACIAGSPRQAVIPLRAPAAMAARHMGGLGHQLGPRRPPIPAAPRSLCLEQRPVTPLCGHGCGRDHAVSDSGAVSGRVACCDSQHALQLWTRQVCYLPAQWCSARVFARVFAVLAGRGCCAGWCFRYLSYSQCISTPYGCVVPYLCYQPCSQDAKPVGTELGNQVK